MVQAVKDEQEKAGYRIALIGVIVEDFTSTEKINEVLHTYRDYIVGRMGVPRAREDIAVISVVLDAPGDVISSVSGKLGMLPGVSCKTVYSKVS